MDENERRLGRSMPWTIIVLAIALVSVVLAILGNVYHVAVATYFILLAIFVVLFTGAKSPW